MSFKETVENFFNKKIESLKKEEWNVVFSGIIKNSIFTKEVPDFENIPFSFLLENFKKSDPEFLFLFRKLDKKKLEQLFNTYPEILDNKILINIIYSNQKISADLLDEFPKLFDGKSFFKNLSKLDENIVIYFLEKKAELKNHKKVWEQILQKAKISKNFIEKYKNNIDWKLLIKNKNINVEEIISHYYDEIYPYIDLPFLLEHVNKLSGDFILKKADEIFKNKGISEKDEFLISILIPQIKDYNKKTFVNFLKKYKENIDWNRFLSFYLNKLPSFYKIENDKLVLLDDLIEINPNLLNIIDKDNSLWDIISMKHPLSISFIEKYKEKLDWTKLALNETLSNEIIEKYKNKFDPNELITYYTVYTKYSPIKLFSLMTDDEIKDSSKVLVYSVCFNDDLIKHFYNKLNWKTLFFEYKNQNKLKSLPFNNIAQVLNNIKKKNNQIYFLLFMLKHFPEEFEKNIKKNPVNISVFKNNIKLIKNILLNNDNKDNTEILSKLIWLNIKSLKDIELFIKNEIDIFSFYPENDKQITEKIKNILEDFDLWKKFFLEKKRELFQKEYPANIINKILINNFLSFYKYIKKYNNFIDKNITISLIKDI